MVQKQLSQAEIYVQKTDDVIPILHFISDQNDCCNCYDTKYHKYWYMVTDCFGDDYIRGGLDLAIQKLLTLCILANLGTEPQIRAHIQGNANMGRERAF